MAAVATAQLLVLKKSADYNRLGMADRPSNAEEAAAFADRDAYFPFGLASYVQMLHVKTQRLVSLTAKAAQGAPNFEGVRDTALDLINYASFLVERTDRERGGLT